MPRLDTLLAFVPEPLLLGRMGLVAGFVMLVALVAERTGPFLGAMVASLPLYTGPIYFMLAFEHDVHYLEKATLGSLAITGATPVFGLAYCIVARRAGTFASLAFALAAWLCCALVVQLSSFSLIEALLFVAPIYAVTVLIARGYTRGVALRQAGRKWWDLPLRALLCGGLAGAIIKAAAYLPAQATGILSVMPILTASLILVLHSRIGGAATAALLANTFGGLVGMVIAFALVHLTIVRLGAALSLSLGLAVTIAWNLALIAYSRLAARRHQTASLRIGAAAPGPRILPPPVRPPRQPPPSQHRQ